MRNVQRSFFFFEVVSSGHNQSINSDLPPKEDNNSRDFEVHDDLIWMANKDLTTNAGGSDRISFLIQNHEINNTTYTIMITTTNITLNLTLGKILSVEEFKVFQTRNAYF